MDFENGTRTGIDGVDVKEATAGVQKNDTHHSEQSNDKGHKIYDTSVVQKAEDNSNDSALNVNSKVVV